MKAALSIALRLAVAIVGGAALSRLRPAWPELPSSLDEPITVTAIEQIVVLVLWVIACLLTAGLFVRTAALIATRGATARRGHLELRATRSGPRQARRSAAARSAAPAYMVAVPAVSGGAGVNTPQRAVAPASSVTTEQPAAPPTPPPQSRAGVTISLLGPLSIEGIDRPRREATRELLAYLALNREATRDQLLEALWPEQDPRRTRPRLWQSVSEAGRLLGEAFIRERDRYRLHPEGVHVDTDDLDRLIALADSADDRPTERAALENALSLWRGEPLAGADYGWAEGTVRHLESRYVNVLERLAQARLVCGDAPAALAAAERGIATDEAHEGLWRLALQAEADCGRRDALNARYEALRQLLDERFGLQPDRATTDLYRRLLGQS